MTAFFLEDLRIISSSNVHTHLFVLYFRLRGDQWRRRVPWEEDFEAGTGTGHLMLKDKKGKEELQTQTYVT
jgi:hypothetical protein